MYTYLYFFKHLLCNYKYYFLIFSDCIQVITNPGTYVVQSKYGSSEPCGVYIAGLHNEIINVEISLVDVSCKTNGLVAVKSKFFAHCSPINLCEALEIQIVFPWNHTILTKAMSHSMLG